jgi:hypothetical protein
VFCFADWESRTQEVYFFESGATSEANFTDVPERQNPACDPFLCAAENIFFPSFLLFVLLSFLLFSQS